LTYCTSLMVQVKKKSVSLKNHRRIRRSGRVEAVPTAYNSPVAIADGRGPRLVERCDPV